MNRKEYDSTINYLVKEYSARRLTHRAFCDLTWGAWVAYQKNISCQEYGDKQ